MAVKRGTSLWTFPNKKCAPKMIFFNEKEKIRIIFDLENWLWKSEIGNFQSLDLERVLIYQKICFMKKCFLLKLLFDVQAAEKILHVIYCVMPIIMILAVLFISGTIISVPCCLIISIFFSALLFKCQWIAFKCVPFLITSSPWQILLETHSQVV